MKNLLSYGIIELDVLKINNLVDILLVTKEEDINNQKELQTVKDLLTYSNLRSAIKLMSEKLMEILDLILQNRFIFTPIQKINLINLFQLTILKVLINREYVAILEGNII